MATAAPSSPPTITATELELRHRVQFAETGELWWSVRAVTVDRHYVILTTPIPDKEQPFGAEEDGGVFYTIIDNERQVRGPDNVWGNGYDTDEQIDRSLQALLDEEIEVSHRPSRWENIRIAAVRPPADTSATDNPVTADAMIYRTGSQMPPHNSTERP